MLKRILFVNVFLHFLPCGEATIIFCLIKIKIKIRGLHSIIYITAGTAIHVDLGLWALLNGQKKPN